MHKKYFANTIGAQIPVQATKFLVTVDGENKVFHHKGKFKEYLQI